MQIADYGNSYRKKEGQGYLLFGVNSITVHMQYGKSGDETREQWFFQRCISLRKFPFSSSISFS